MGCYANVAPSGIASECGCLVHREGGSYGKRAICVNDRRACEQSHAGPRVCVTEPISLQVVDQREPAGSLAHSFEQIPRLVFRQMVQEERAHDQVVLIKWIDEDIKLAKVDVRNASTLGGAFGEFDRGRADIAAVDFETNPMGCGEFRDSNRDIPAARGDIQHA